MNFVLEGPDGGGKSTLADAMSKLLGMPVIQGEGPPKSPEEFHSRCLRVNRENGVIFDRIPYISDRIYSEAAGRRCLIDRELALDFFTRRKPFVIYVKPTTYELPRDHACKSHETPEHVAMVATNHKSICEAYETRMLHIAHYVYRRGDKHLLNVLAAARDSLIGGSDPRSIHSAIGTERAPQLGNEERQPDAHQPEDGRNNATPYGHLAEAFADANGRPHG